MFAVPCSCKFILGFLSFSIEEGSSAIISYSKTNKHQKVAGDKDKNRNELPAKQMRIEKCLRNQEEIHVNKTHQKQEENILP